MVFYGLNGSSVAFNGSAVRARSFDVYKVNVSVIDNTSYTSHSAYPYSMMYTTAYDSAKNVLYTSKVEAGTPVEFSVPSNGYISVIRPRPEYRRFTWGTTGIDLIGSSIFPWLSHDDGYFYNFYGESALFQITGDTTIPMLCGESSVDQNKYVFSSEPYYDAFYDTVNHTRQMLFPESDVSSIEYKKYVTTLSGVKYYSLVGGIFESHYYPYNNRSGNRWSGATVRLGLSAHNRDAGYGVMAVRTAYNSSTLLYIQIPPNNQGFRYCSGSLPYTSLGTNGSAVSSLYAMYSRAQVTADGSVQWYFSGVAL